MIRVLRHYGLQVGDRPNLSWRELVQALKANAVIIVSFTTAACSPSSTRTTSRDQVATAFQAA